MKRNLTTQQRQAGIAHGSRLGRGESGNHFRQENGKAFSYSTCLVAAFPDGTTIGNDTYYSTTTSNHQVKARAGSCDIVVIGVPEGTADLAEWFLANFFTVSANDMVTYKTGALPASIRKLISDRIGARLEVHDAAGN